MWIDPEGIVHEVEFALHESFAATILRERYHEEPNIDHVVPQLFAKGWISVHEDWMIGTTIENYKRMTFEQYQTLYKRFGDRRLFRGWTVKQLYDEARPI
jgi:hypothetical protein